MEKLIFYIVSILLYYLFCICVYMMIEEKKERRIIKKSKIINKKIGKILSIEIKNIKESRVLKNNSKNIRIIKRYIKNNNYQQLLFKYLLELDNRKEISDFFNKTKILDECINDKKNNEVKKAFFIYIIGQFRIEDKYEYLISNCDSKSLYIQVNTLKALANLGNYDYYIKALKKILISKTLIHRKIIIESLFHFNEVNSELNRRLIQELNTDNVELDVLIINYYTSIKYNDINYIIYELLEDENTDKEIIIASIKYFLENDSKDIKNILIKLLKNDNWEIRTISATAIRKYNGVEIIEALKETLTDKVWYVRQNSARSLNCLVKDKDELFKIIDTNDRYAYDAILSVLSEENELDEYMYK